jgi:hypothetical protein
MVAEEGAGTGVALSEVKGHDEEGRLDWDPGKAVASAVPVGGWVDAAQAAPVQLGKAPLDSHMDWEAEEAG